MIADTQRQRDWWLWPLAALAGLLFFGSLGRLWPLAATDLTVPRATLEARASQGLAARRLVPAGRTLGEYAAAEQLAVDEAGLDYVERTFGRSAAQSLVRAGASLVAYDVLYKRPGDPDGLAVSMDGAGRVVGWSRGVQDDAAGRAPDGGLRPGARACGARRRPSPDDGQRSRGVARDRRGEPRAAGAGGPHVHSSSVCSRRCPSCASARSRWSAAASSPARDAGSWCRRPASAQRGRGPRR